MTGAVFTEHRVGGVSCLGHSRRKGQSWGDRGSLTVLPRRPRPNLPDSLTEIPSAFQSVGLHLLVGGSSML